MKNMYKPPEQRGKQNTPFSKTVWFDKSTFPSSNPSDHEVIAACEIEFNSLNSKLNMYYEDARHFERLYQYRSALDKEQRGGQTPEENFSVDENNTLTFNLTRACCNSAHNKIAKLTPKVTFLTKDAERQVIETAKKLDNWIFKIFKKCMIYKEASLAFLDACVKGIGVLKLYKYDNKIKIKKISSTDVFFDNAYTGYHYPKTMGEKKSISVYDLKNMFPEKAHEIELYHGGQDKVLVKEMYRKKKMKVMYTEKVLLIYEKREKSLPYVLIKWTEATEGVVGLSISKEVAYLHQTITYILHRIVKAVHLFAVPRVIVQKGANPTKIDIGNETGEFIEINTGDGPIQMITPPAVNEQVMRILMMFWEKGFEVTGLSQLQAHGQIPQGLKQASGAALRTYNQIESERFQLIRKDYESLFVTIAKKIIEFSDSFPEGVSKKEVEEAKDNINLFSSNILPETPAGRQAMVSDLFNSQLITRTQALSLLDSQDTQKLINSEAARISAIEMELERAVKTGKTPDTSIAATLGLEEYLDRTRKIYAEIVIEKGSDSNDLVVLQTIIDELQTKITQQAQVNAMQNQNNTTPDSNRNLQLENLAANE